MSLSTIREAIQTALEGITDLKVYKEIPEAVEQFPAAILDTEAVVYQQTNMPATMATYTFRLVLLVGQRDAPDAATQLDDYLALTGTKSVKAVVEAASIGAVRRVERAENIGPLSYRGTTFYGAEFVMTVIE